MKDDEIINKALEILKKRLHKPNHIFTNPQDTKNFLTLKYSEQEHESFNVAFLNTKNGLISLTEMFNGTIDQATVYPREVVKMALKFNAAAVILSHNHPSGVCEPSPADKQITKTITNALNLVDIRTLDHIVVGGTESYSFAEHGLL